MTYPPQPGQPPYGHQPNPYDQSGFPASGGFPQQGGQYPPPAGPPPQQDPYGQYGGSYGDRYGGQFADQQGWYGHQPGYGHPGYGQPGDGGFGGRPPGGKNRTGLWIGLSAAVVAVVAFLITGLAVPGFLLGDEEDDTTATAARDDHSGGTGTSTEPTEPTLSSPAFPGVEETPGGDGDPAPAASGEAGQLAERFLGALHSGDGDAALGHFCPNTTSLSEEHVSAVVNGSAELTATPSGEPREDDVATVHLYDVRGTLDGSGTSGLLSIVDMRGELCVSTFTLF
ncbi:hypothetical protein [Saccharomonospora iraqiensis]|uniref:hypothetical protein n=1 Tax=Saccharomonospora iraqiensis TaxID=52698 RepID=UPI00022E89AE|nr:hypothetical protein [Saccharomonospora iraqiensis]